MEALSQLSGQRISGGAVAMGAMDAYYAKQAQNACGEKEEARQSEIEREVHRLLLTAEKLEGLVNKTVKTVEKVTRGEMKDVAVSGTAAVTPVPATVLGRDLDSINGRLQSSMSILQSTIQRIEL